MSLVVGLIDEMRARHPELDTDQIDDVVLGVVSPIGDQGGDIAKTAAIAAGLPDTVAGVQLNRFCASGLEAVNTAALKVRSGMEELVLAGGVEVMSRCRWAPTAAPGPWTPTPPTPPASSPRASAPTSSPPWRASRARTSTRSPSSRRRARRRRGPTATSRSPSCR